MLPGSARTGALAATLALSSVVLAAPAGASCLPLADLLPDPGSPDTVVFEGTVVGSQDVTTDMLVEAWYTGAAEADEVTVVGGREPGAITSVDWRPAAGQRFVVLAERAPDGTLVTGTCHQSEPYPALLSALEARYGAPQPVVTSGGSPRPGSLVHGTPAPSPHETVL